MIDALAAIAATILAAVIAVGLWLGTTATGPDCPGMDPEWVGWCK